MAKTEKDLVLATAVPARADVKKTIARGAAKGAALAARSKASPEALIREAIKAGIGPEGMKQLMDMRRELVAEKARREYFEALTAFQAELKPIIKAKAVPNKKERIDEGADPVRFRYAPIEKIVEAIQKGEAAHGFSHTWDAGSIDNGLIPINTFIHHTGGHTEKVTFPSPLFYEDGKAIGQSKSQVVTAAISYGRRQGLIMGYGITSADPEAALAPQVAGEPQPLPAEGSKTAPAAPSKERNAADAGDLHREVMELIPAKSKGQAAKRFKDSADASLRRGLKANLVALRDQLRKMKNVS